MIAYHHDRIIDRVMPCEVAYQKPEENEIKLQFPLPTSGGDRFRKSTSGPEVPVKADITKM